MNASPRSEIYHFLGWLFLINGLLFCLVGYSYLYNILSSASLFATFAVQYSSLAARLFLLLFSVMNYFSYLFLFAFIPCAFLGLLTLILPWKRLIALMSIVLLSLTLLLLLIDLRIFALFKFHLNETILRMILDGQWIEIFDLSSREIGWMLLWCTLILSLETGFVFLIYRRHLFLCSSPFRWVLLWFGGFLFSYFTLLQSIVTSNNLLSQQTPNLPWYNQVMAQLIPDKNAEDVLFRYSEGYFAQPLFSNETLYYPRKPMACTPPKHPLNIILIMVDSLRFDSLQKSVMPNLMRFAQESWSFEQHLSGGNATQPGLFSLFYSIPSNYWTAALAQKKTPVWMSLLRRYGYEMGVFWSSEMVIPPFHHSIYLGIPGVEQHSSPDEEVAARDRFVTTEAIRFLQRRPEKPFFLNLFYDAPHGYCRHQDFPQPFQPAIKNCFRFAINNEIDPLPYYHRYLNAVHFVDGELAKVLQVVQHNGYLNNSIVIVTADHAEEFNDNRENYWGHSGNFTNAQIQVPLLIHWPNQKPRRFSYVSSHYDLVPTLLKQVYHCKNPIRDYSIGQDLLQEKGRLPFVLVGSYVNMGVVEEDRISTLQKSGSIRISTRQAKPLLGAKPRMEILKQALGLMRLYFIKQG